MNTIPIHRFANFADPDPRASAFQNAYQCNHRLRLACFTKPIRYYRSHTLSSKTGSTLPMRQEIRLTCNHPCMPRATATDHDDKSRSVAGQEIMQREHAETETLQRGDNEGRQCSEETLSRRVARLPCLSVRLCGETDGDNTGRTLSRLSSVR